MKHLPRLAASAALYYAILGTCGVASEPARAATHVLNPQTIDPSATVSGVTDRHIAISPTTTAVNKLFVFLPGTSGFPALYTLIINSGAGRGYHTIGLTYPNSSEIGDYCVVGNPLGSPNDCFWLARTAIVEGNPPDPTPPYYPVTQSDAIVPRLTKAITYLRDNFSTEGWGQYLKTDGTIDWSKVTVGGHSQGGGNAGVMAKLYAMHRTCYFASPPDWAFGAPATWMSYTNVTPASAQFGFTGYSDPSVPESDLAVIWPTLGMTGSVISVDTNSPPYSSSQELDTNATPATAPPGTPGVPLHGLTVRDVFTPKDPVTGQPIFDPVWGYLCFQ